MSDDLIDNNKKIEFVRTWPRGMELYKQIAEINPVILLSFSNGKDSLGAWLALRDSGLFERIIPFYGWVVPGLKFIEDALSYYEDFFKTEILRYPSPSFYGQLKSGNMMPKWNADFMNELALDANWDYTDLAATVCEDQKISPDTFVATGIRAVDNMTRLAAMKRTGPVSYNLLKFHPIWDWNKNVLMTRIHKSGLLLPPDYLAFGRSLDGTDRRFMGPMKALWPDDYKKVKEFFPLVDAVLWREIYARRHRF